MRTRHVLVVLVGLLAGPATARGQRASGAAPQWEARTDVTVSPDLAAHGGLGVNVRAGPYMRLGLAYLAGVARGPRGDRDAGFSQRLDASARFLLDPYAERPRGLYGGAGFTARQDAGEALRGDLMLVMGIEGAARGRATPSIELTLGGGVRVGVVLRQPRARRFGR